MRTIQLNLTRAQYDALLKSCQITISEAKDTILEKLLDADDGERGVVFDENQDQYRALTALNPTDELHSAIGYLCTWSLPGEDNNNPTTHCTVSCADTDKPELVAQYYKATAHGAAAYTLAAIWHDTHWGFHS